MLNQIKKSSSRSMFLLLSITLACGLFAAGCANDLDDSDKGNNSANNTSVNNSQPEPDASTPDDSGNTEETYANVVHEKSAEGWTHTTIDSSDAEKWIYLQLSTGAQTDVSDPATATNWDLAFRRFSILVNGGVSGPSNVEIAHVEGVSFESITQVPADTEFRTDVEGEPDERGQNPGLAFQIDETWYDYNGATHELTPRDRIYFIHASSGEYYKLQFLDYYDQAGTSGFVQFKWQEIDAPEDTETPEEPEAFPVLTSTFDASSAEEFIYVHLKTNEEVAVEDAAASEDWDIAFQKTTSLVNGGVSGPGNVAIAHVDEVDFDEVTKDSADNFRTDEEAAGEAFKADSNWYAYDMTTHTLSPRDRVYIVQSASGEFFKLQFLSYYNDAEPPAAGHITIKTQQLD